MASLIQSQRIVNAGGILTNWFRDWLRKLEVRVDAITSVPSGTDGQTLRYNGTTIEATSDLVIGATEITTPLDIRLNGNNITTAATDDRTKYRVWDSVAYGVGGGDSYTFGGLNGFAVTFQTNNNANRGFWWGDDNHTNNEGAMALTSQGFLTVASGVRIGFGDADTTAPTGTGLTVSGTITASGYNSSNWDTAYTYSQVGHIPSSLDCTTGSIDVGIEDDYWRWRLGGTGDPAGIRLDSYDSPRFTVTRDGALSLTASLPYILVQDTDGTNQYLRLEHSAGATVLTSRNNTGNGNIQFRLYDGTTTTTQMFISANGNVAIGNTGPSRELEVTNSGDVYALIETTGTTGTTGLLLGDANSDSIARVSYSHNANDLQFWGNGARRATIASDGTYCMGGTTLSAVTGASVNGIAIEGGGRLNQSRSNTTTIKLQRFYNSSGEQGSIEITASGVNFNVTSDERLKTNIRDCAETGDLIDSLSVREFDWKADGSHQRYGFIAQEVYEDFPEAVSHSDDTWGVDNSKLVPVLVNEIQSLRQRVSALESRS